MGSEMSKIALNTNERILLRVPNSTGYEWLDPQLMRGATYQDVADEATAYGATEIRRFDENAGHVEDITDTVFLKSNVDVTGDDLPLWVRHADSFEAIRSEEVRASRQIVAHERSFQSPSIYVAGA